MSKALAKAMVSPLSTSMQNMVRFWLLYVDDLSFTVNDNFLISEFKEGMKNEFEMKDLGLLKYLLGI